MCPRKGWVAAVALLTSLTAALAIRPYKISKIETHLRFRRKASGECVGA